MRLLDDRLTTPRQEGSLQVSAATPDLQVHLLGEFTLRCGGHILIDSSWPRRKARALVKLVAISPSHSLHREQVLEALWPGLEPDAAANNLRQNLHFLRVALETAGCSTPVLVAGRDMISLAPDARVDANEFARLAREALASPTDIELFEAALAIYGGPLLPEDRYEDWSAAPRERLEELHRHLLQQVAGLYAANSQTGRAEQTLEELVSGDSLDEETHRALMRLYAASGGRDRALRLYKQLVEKLRRELDAAPSPETEALASEIMAGGHAIGGLPVVSLGGDIWDGAAAPASIQLPQAASDRTVSRPGSRNQRRGRAWVVPGALVTLVAVGTFLLASSAFRGRAGEASVPPVVDFVSPQPVVLETETRVSEMTPFDAGGNAPDEIAVLVLYSNNTVTTQSGLTLKVPVPDGTQIAAEARGEIDPIPVGERLWNLPDLHPGETQRFEFTLQLLSASVGSFPLVTEIDGGNFTHGVDSAARTITVSR